MRYGLKERWSDFIICDKTASIGLYNQVNHSYHFPGENLAKKEQTDKNPASCRDSKFFRQYNQKKQNDNRPLYLTGFWDLTKTEVLSQKE
jgi:hypothetical protein